MYRYYAPLFALASCSSPLTDREDLIGLGGKPAEPGGVSTGALLFSTEMPRPFLEVGWFVEVASKPADRIAASSSLLLGSWICGGVPVLLGEGCLPHNDAAAFVDGALVSAFSLSSSIWGDCIGFLRVLKPPISGVAALSCVDSKPSDFAGTIGVLARVAGFSGSLGSNLGVPGKELAIKDATDPGGARSFGVSIGPGAFVDASASSCGCVIGFATVSGSIAALSALAPACLRFFGPRARPLRMSSSGSTEDDSFAILALGIVDDRSGGAMLLADEEAFAPPAAVGGPRASIPARPGLKRAANTLVPLEPWCSSSAGALACLDKGSSLVCATSVMSVFSTGTVCNSGFCAGRTVFGFTSGVRFTFAGLPVARSPSNRASRSRFAKASGLGGVTGVAPLIFRLCT